MITIVPMAGRGSRFSDKGIDIPKPLISVSGKPMLQWALKSIENVPHRMIVFVALREHEEAFGISKLLPGITDTPHALVLLDEVTEGQLCTVLTAREYMVPGEGILVSNCDTYTVSSIGQDIKQAAGDVRGLISVADLPGDRWSFAKADVAGRVIQVAEKDRIADHASTGLYYFSETDEFLAYADRMIRLQQRTKGEYYVMPLYSFYLEDGKEIRLSHAEKMWDFGTPEALAEFLASQPSA